MITNVDMIVGRIEDHSRPPPELVKDIKKTAGNGLVNQAIDLLITEFMNGKPVLRGPEAGQFDEYIFDVFERQLVWSILTYNMAAFRVVIRKDGKIAVIMEPIEHNRVIRGYNSDKSRVVYGWVYDKNEDGTEVNEATVPDNMRVHILSMNAADINLTWFNSAVSDLTEVVEWMMETEKNEQDANYAAAHPLSYANYRHSNVKGASPSDPLRNDGLTGDVLPRSVLELLRRRDRTARPDEDKPLVAVERVALPREHANKRMRAGELVAFTLEGYEISPAQLPVSNSRLIDSNYFVRRIASRVGIPMSMLMSSIGGRHNIEDSRNEMAPLRASVARLRKHLDDVVIYLSRMLFADNPTSIFIEWAQDIEVTSIYTDMEKRDGDTNKDEVENEEDSGDSDETEHHSGSEHGDA